nr:YhcH/YjgK/YiaL family protein [Parabacteroides goldsteinii]
MKQIFYSLIVVILFCMMGCKSEKKKSSELSAQYVSEWISRSGWYKELKMKPDKNVNQELFVLQNERNIKAWQVAFDFLRRNDLNELALGRYDLSNDGTYATVSEYETKEHETARYEAHRKYIDIQYVSKGEEYIDLLPMDEITERQDYDEQADIMFFDGKLGTRLYANKEQFFVFFPDDVHRPCLKIDTAAMVRKIVVKIPWSD